MTRAQHIQLIFLAYQKLHTCGCSMAWTWIPAGWHCKYKRGKVTMTQCDQLCLSFSSCAAINENVAWPGNGLESAGTTSEGEREVTSFRKRTQVI